MYEKDVFVKIGGSELTLTDDGQGNLVYSANCAGYWANNHD